MSYIVEYYLNKILIYIDFICFISYYVLSCITRYLAKGVPKSVPKIPMKNCHLAAVKHGVHYSNSYAILAFFLVKENTV